MKERLISVINGIRSNKSLLTLDEASIKSGVVLRLLSLLGWDPFDINEVRPEYSVASKRVDFSLRISAINKVFIEVKRPNENLDSHQEQLLGYSFREGVKLAILTNGITWWFYLPLNEGSWEQRRFFTADFSEQESEVVAERFIDLLSRENIASGDAIKNAEHLYKSRQRRDILKETLPKAWHKIINDPDDLLVELLIETTEKLSGFRPEISDIEKFLSGVTHPSVSRPEVSSPPTMPKPTTVVRHGIVLPMADDYINKTIRSFTFLGKTYYPHTWKELLVTVSEEIYRRHPAEFNRCLSLRGSKMVYFSLTSNELSLPARISGSEYFAETKLNANSIVRRCRDLLALFGYRDSDLTVIAE